MTHEQQRNVKAQVLLDHAETKQLLGVLRARAWNMAERFQLLSALLDQARRLDAYSETRLKEVLRRVEGDQAAFAEAANLGAVTDLLAEILAAHAKLEELSRQKAALGFD